MKVFLGIIIIAILFILLTANHETSISDHDNVKIITPNTNNELKSDNDNNNSINNFNSTELENNYILSQGELEDATFRTLESTMFSFFNDKELQKKSLYNEIMFSYESLLSQNDRNEMYGIFKFIDTDRKFYSFMDHYTSQEDSENFHMGIEIKTNKLEDVYSPGNGKVACLTGLKTIPGFLIIIHHNYEFFKGYTLISGLSDIVVKKGSKVNTSSKIGKTKYANLFIAIFDIEYGFVNPDNYLISLSSSSKNDNKNEKLNISELEFYWPIDLPELTSKYGYRKNPFNKSEIEFHSGVDIINNKSNPSIHPIGEGIVVATYYKHPLKGNAVVIKHFDSDFVSRYYHLNKIHVEKGDKVGILDTIGKMGNTGKSTEPHLHLTILKNGKIIDPQLILPNIAIYAKGY